jgi:antitoxin component YwqK of YwqJK toxin-antitoxin module
LATTTPGPAQYGQERTAKIDRFSELQFESAMDADLSLAEIGYESGPIKFRYSRYMASDGTRWIRHGLFVAYHENGAVSSEGNYVHGAESGIWREYHPNGQLAAEGNFVDGQEVGVWRFWGEDGAEQPQARRGPQAVDHDGLP